MSWRGVENLADPRAFLQKRVALLFGSVAAFISGFWVIGFIVAMFAGPTEAEFWDNLPHLIISIDAIFIWLFARRGERSILKLRLLESVGSFLVCACLSATLLSKDFRDFADMGPLMGVTMILVLRATLVPSQPVRTFFISLFSGLTGAIILSYAYRNEVLPVEHPWKGTLTPFQAALVMTGTWAVSFSIVAAIISRLFYGLQAKVREQLRLGQYSLEEKLGEGGMGEVYRARHAMLRRPTAVKLLPVAKAGEKSIARFEQEVRQTARLKHPNTVAIYDFGRTPEGVFYYAMELLDGLTLAEVVERDGPQQVSRVVHLMRQIAGALDEAHDVGLMHRDIKPANVLVCQRRGFGDVAKVVDFGLVKELDSGGNLSMTGTLVGTPLYLAPEAITNPEELDHRGDLYALGCVGYFLLTGTNVFEGKTVVEICSHHLHSTPVPPSVRADDVPPALEAIILRLLSKDPNDRYPDAPAVLEALEGIAPRWTSRDAHLWWDAQGLGDAGALRRTTQPPIDPQAMTVDLGVR